MRVWRDGSRRTAVKTSARTDCPLIVLIRDGA